MRQTIKDVCLRFCRDEYGGTAIEYALIAGGVGITVMASIQAVGGETRKPFTSAASELSAANSSAP